MVKKAVPWSTLPQEFIKLLAVRSSNTDLLRIRSICKPWRSAVAPKGRFLNRFKRSVVGPFNRRKKSGDLLSNTFFRVTQASSSCPEKGWLIKTRQADESSKANLLSPLSNKPITCSDKTLDLSKFGVSEIRQTYNVQFLNKQTKKLRDASRAVLVENHVFVVDTNKQLWSCLRVEGSSSWKRVKNEDVEEFSDVILHNGQVYALDLIGTIWQINNSLSDFTLSQYGPSTFRKYCEIQRCKDKRLVEVCGDLCVLHRLYKKGKNVHTTNGFKVFKMDKELVEWVEVSSLGDKALIVASDSCFTDLASEYHGCLENAVYFNDDNDGYEFRKGVKGKAVKVLKFDDSTIINSSSDSCFEMFSSPFL